MRKRISDTRSYTLTSKIADKASESTYQKSYQQKLLDKINHDVEQMNMSLDSIPDDDDEYGI